MGFLQRDFWVCSACCVDCHVKKKKKSMGLFGSGRVLLMELLYVLLLKMGCMYCNWFSFGWLDCFVMSFGYFCYCVSGLGLLKNWRMYGLLENRPKTWSLKWS